ncbi:S8 family peptidase [Peptococcus simiae]|uniref:S8 family peptidase n=1 Tax=Peptococcus simiae TaxID=1643805 RepID=A0ABW9H3V0_9FIRM
MNNILHLKGQLAQKSSPSKPGPANLPKDKKVTIEHLASLRNDLIAVKRFWETSPVDINPLVSAYYTDVVAKSNRIKGIFPKGADNKVVGAKFTSGLEKKHIITHCITPHLLSNAIDALEKAIKLAACFGDAVSFCNIKDIHAKKHEELFKDISRSSFTQIVVDAYYLERLFIDNSSPDLANSAIITLYETGVTTEKIMKQLGLDVSRARIIDGTTILLSPEQYSQLKAKAPYLIAMGVSDIAELEKDMLLGNTSHVMKIPSPSSEPTIGVIDTMFDKRVYFSEWVESKNMLDDSIELRPEDYNHGTQVSSIIVDGANINPDLDDGCGRFKVRHFGVATSGRFSSFTVIRLIKEIVEANKDIKVWNLSLGAALEINENFISPEAAILDKLQFENDVIFIVAGTNKGHNPDIRKIGAPADSINSLVVNAVDFQNKPANYSREGLVLSFFNKPDISYYGGDRAKGISVCSPCGQASVMGTSYAAPWIARKMAYLIYIAGLSREVAKALIIDSATSWSKDSFAPYLMGYGVVPIRIENVLQSKNDEIKFIISGTAEKFETYSYNIPVPINKSKHPFVAKATLCYFPSCSRNQGVDYTDTEMDIHFGRLKKNKTSTSIESINQNRQSDEGYFALKEEKARKLFRKWDNIKHIREYLLTEKGNKRQPKTVKENGLWGLSIKTKERLGTTGKTPLNFGLVVTLKEVNGINRIEEFIQQCQLRGWLVNEIDNQTRLDIYNLSEETISFE